MGAITIVACRFVLYLWREIMIPMYRLWLHSLYGLYGPRCPLSPKRLLNLITHSLTPWVDVVAIMIKVQCFSKIWYIAVMHSKWYPPVNGVMGFGQCIHSSRYWFVWKRIGVMLCKKSAQTNSSGKLRSVPKAYNCYGRLISVSEDLLTTPEHLLTTQEHLLTSPEHFRNCIGTLL